MKSMRALLLVTLSILVIGCSRDDPASLVASAKKYLGKRDFSASIIQLKNALQKEPENTEARYLLGLLFLESGDVGSAEIELRKASDLGLRTDELQVALARAALAGGASDKVLAEFGSKTLSSPKLQAELRALVGMAQFAQGRSAEGQAALAEALALDPANVTANLGLARLAASERDFRKALSRVDTALSASPARFETLLLKADLLAVQGQSEAAELAYRDAIRAAPHEVAPRLSLVTHLLRNRSLEKASAEVEALEKMAPKDPRTSYAKALLLTGQRKFAAAREAILEVLKVAPEHVPSLTLAGMAAFQSGAYPEAESHLRKAVFNAPNALEAKRLLAATHLRMGQTDLALTEVRELLTQAGKDPNILALAGEAYLASGDVAGAARQYEQAKALAPEDAGVQTRLANIRFAAGDPARGIAELESASASHPEEYQADLALVANYLRQRQPDKALEALQALEKKQPDNPLTHNLRGLALVLKLDYAGARASFERTVQLRPNDMAAIANLAQLDLREKKFGAARKRYEAVLKKEPGNEQALLGLSVLLRVTGANPQEIEKLLKHSVASNPASPSARASLINYYLRGRDYKGALAAAQDAQVALPNNPGMVQALGVAQLAAGETRQAIATFTRLAELTPKAPEPELLLARAQMAAKQPDEAIKALRAVLALRPDLASAQRDIAAIYVATGRNKDALREARAVQAENPKQAFGYALEAEVYVAEKKWDSAERVYREALKKFDLSALVARTHAVMEAAGKRSEAEALAEDWIKRHPSDASVLAYLADRDIAAKRYESAAQRYHSALERQPNNALFLNNLAWATKELKQPRALEYAERAHELAPDNPEIMDTLASILSEKGQSERGLELLGRAAELAPDAYQIRLNFAKALIKAGRKGAARKELEVLAKLDRLLPIQREAAALLASL
jgi:putative PEP-CTERM system TPR-repeat lipoprotein